MNCFCGDEAALKIGMDYTCRSRCFVALMNCPSARFLFAGGEKSAQAKKMINRANERVDAAVLDAETAQIFERFLFAKIDKLTLDLRADHDRLGSKMMLRVIANKIDMFGSRV